MIDNFISKKVLKNLEDIPITERPIHCTDQKRRNFMVKDKNEGWVKDSVDTNGSLYTQVKQIHSKAYIDFYTEYDKVHPLPHDTDHETFKCEMTSKLLNYDKQNLVNDIAKTADIRDVVGPVGITIEDGSETCSLTNTNSPFTDNNPVRSMKPMEKSQNKIKLGNIKLNNIVSNENATVINHNTTTTTVDANVMDIKNNMMNMVNMMNSMVGKLEHDSK
jgi:peroxiredoxin family protein